MASIIISNVFAFGVGILLYFIIVPLARFAGIPYLDGAFIVGAAYFVALAWVDPYIDRLTAPASAAPPGEAHAHRA